MLRSLVVPRTLDAKSMNSFRTVLLVHQRRYSTRSASFAEAGATRIYLQVLDMDDLDHIHLLAEEVMKVLP